MTDDPTFLHHRKSEGRLQWRPTLEWLRTEAQALPPAELPHGRVFMVALLFLKCVFGQSWVDENVFGQSFIDEYIEKRIVPPGRGPDFLHPDLSGTDEMQTEKMQIRFQRVIDLAEMIFNFKAVGIYNLDNCLDQLAGWQIESGLAELYSAKLLILYGIPFQFHIPIGEKGKDYDLDVVFQNKIRGCADTKCYIESLDFRASRIKGRLNEAREQLPPNLPGVVIIKIPQQWRNKSTIFNETVSTVKRFLAGSTQRIVSIIVYSALITPTKSGPGDGLTVREYTNKKHRFDKRLNWSLFPLGRPYVPRLGPKWVSFWNMYETLKNPVLRVLPTDDD